MNLSGHESRRLRQMEERLAVEDPDLASLLSGGLDRPGPAVPFSARRGPHGPPATISGTAKTMMIAIACLVVMAFGAYLLSPGSAPEGDKRDRQAQQKNPRAPQCRTVSMRDPACQGQESHRYYAPGS